MPPRDLDTRRLKFAAGVAQGKTYSAAYREAGYSAKGKPTSVGRNAQKLSQNAHVQEAIREMRQQLLPDPGDVRDLYTHAMGVMVELSLHSRDDRVRYQASAWIREEAAKQIAETEEREAAERPRESTRTELLAELRGLYARSLPAPAEREPLVVEVESEE